MAIFNVNASLADADVTTIETKVNDIQVLLPFLVNLDPPTRKRLRKKGTKRSGYVEDVYNAASSNAPVIPSTFDMVSFTNRKKLDTQLQHLLDIIGPLREALDDTRLATGNDLMKQSDTCYQYLQRGAKDNASLTGVVDNIAKTFAGQGRRKKKAVLVPQV